MSTACDNLRETIDALVEGRFDALSPEQVEAATQHLDSCTPCAERVGSAQADPTQDPLVGSADSATALSEDRLASLWPAIEQDLEAVDAKPSHSAKPAWLNTWARMSAAAAILMGITLWQLRPTAAVGWDMQLAGLGDVDIESVEVHGSETLLVMDAELVDGASVIWVIEE